MSADVALWPTPRSHGVPADPARAALTAEIAEIVRRELRILREEDDVSSDEIAEIHRELRALRDEGVTRTDRPNGSV